MTTVFDGSSLDATDDGGANAAVTFRILFPANLLSAASGNQIQVSFRTGTGSAAGSPDVSGAWVGRGAGAGSINFTGNQVQLKFSGSNTFNVTGASQTVTADVATLGENFDNTKDYVVAFRMDAIGAANTTNISGTITSVGLHFLAGSTAGEEALTTASGGYTTIANTDDFVRQIFITSSGDTLGGSMPRLMMSRRKRDPVKTLLLPSRYRRYTRGFALAA